MPKQQQIRMGAPLKPAPLVRPLERTYLDDDVQALLARHCRNLSHAFQAFIDCWVFLEPTANPAAFRSLLAAEPLFASNLLRAVVVAKERSARTQHDRILAALHKAGGSNRSYAKVATQLRVGKNTVELAASRERARQLKKLERWKATIVSENGVSRLGTRGDVELLKTIITRVLRGLPVRF